MQDVWNPQLTKKIDTFMFRKNREFPELSLMKKWYEYEMAPRPLRQGKTKKYAIAK